ncbi:ATP synthase E chain-domain-containing protein [Acrodontium crateriforme]|uniref:ATP synthase F(0) complex subunit e, mitochondrial n=1 Tax=Acrodontium crateriforme TaxID=150365 RepID=A0AAQ3LX87_9PEZI|nr:ATP synthase E chain-domain-containing protein [Acrodontium crateriforme]
MASTGVNVLRWSALAAGVFYGFTRQSSITARDKAAVEKAEWDSKVKAIEDAKKAYKEKTQPKTSSGEYNQKALCGGYLESIARDTIAQMTREAVRGMRCAKTFIAVITDPMDPKFDLEKYLGTIKA